jgi:hypothetical protein
MVSFLPYLTRFTLLMARDIRAANQFRIPLTKSKHASSFIKKAGVQLWNSQMPEISYHVKIGKFKKDIKAKFLEGYLDPLHDDTVRV